MVLACTLEGKVKMLDMSVEEYREVTESVDWIVYVALSRSWL